MYQIDFHKPIHIFFCGIGGISMSGLAEILHQAGFRVSGSDWKESDITKDLESKGITVLYGENSAHITDDIDCAVLTAAVHEDNKEFQAIRAKNIPYMSRAELLGQIMKNYASPIAISGTHGKTTTTSMVSDILMAADTDPTISVGGILETIGGNIRVGHSDYFVTEACEYTNSFLSFFPKLSIILNIEEDHMDFFHDLQEIRDSFHTFAKLLPEDGLLIINGDIENYEEITRDLPCKVLTFGSTNTCDYYPAEITYNSFGHISALVHTTQGASFTVSLKIPGKHNLSNALAAIALTDYLGIDRQTALDALKVFVGSKRRFEYKGSLGTIDIIDDYAHHPTEIAATLTAAKNYPHNELWCVFQPHTFTRTKAFMDEFAHALSLADHVVLADIYPARETDNLGISSRDLQAKITALGKDVHYFSSFDAIENFLLENVIHNDMVITMGAGDIVKVGEKLLGM